MTSDRAYEFAVVILVMAMIAGVALPQDYYGVSPQEGFLAAFDERLGAAMAEHEDEINDFILSEMRGAETMEEAREFILMEGNTPVELVFLDMAQSYSFARQMQILRQVMARANPGEQYLDILLTETGFGDIGIAETGMFLGFASEGGLYDGENLDFDLLADIDYFFGEGTADGLLAMDVNDRLVAMGGLFGDFYAELIGEDPEAAITLLVLPALFSTVLTAPIQIAAAEQDGFGVYELTLGADDLEERAALMIESGLTIVYVDIFVQADYNLNVFLVNRDVVVVEITFYLDAPADFNFEGLEASGRTRLMPGEALTLQIPAEKLGEINSIGITSGTGMPVYIEAGFRLTNYPLP